MTKAVNFGGLDPALRVDNCAFTKITWQDHIFEETGNKVWPHIHPKIIMNDLQAINKIEKFYGVGYDRLGTGELIKMFPPEIPFVEVISTMQQKLDIIGLLVGLFDNDKLIIHSEDLKREILEQEKYVSDAGNVLYRHPQGFHDDRFWSLGYAVKAATDFIKKMPTFKVIVAETPKTMEGQITEDMLNNI